ncbi:AI-2E family transporter [Methanosarcina sp. Mfa9]|uniref:AI-2E family transporter n=1 Tax=Methanosarcina sp. Mfa9 TaxID=3439063 RepID=UPI003F874D2D
MESPFKMSLALFLIIILAAALSYALLPYINYFFGAFILFAIFRPLYVFLRGKPKFRKGTAALTSIVVSIIVVLIPLYFLLSIIVGETQALLEDSYSTRLFAQIVDDFFSQYLSRFDLPYATIQAEVEGRVLEFASEAVNFVSKFILDSIQGLSRQVVGFTIMYFLLYYLFTSEEGLLETLHKVIPFNKENTEILLGEFGKIVHSVLISSGIIAIFQGGVLTLAFLVFGVGGAFLWGFIAALLSFLPIVGATFVWVPAAIVQLLQHDYFAGIGIIGAGIIISSVDNLLRPFIQEKVGALHPFHSLLGIIIGVSLFGLIGIVVGTLLLSYFILIVRMFSEEYLSGKAQKGGSYEAAGTEGKSSDEEKRVNKE